MIKKLLRFTKKGSFKQICQATQLNLDYQLNREGVPILKDIFIGREYADYFPFYEKVTVVDIGAHFGYFSLFASRNTHPEAKILAFEPSARNFAVLQQNIRDTGCTNVQAFQRAVGGQNGNGALFEGESFNNSLIPNYLLLEEEHSKTTVSITDLESILTENNLEMVDFLKVDCEGAEYEIFLTIEPDVLRKNKVVSMEFHDLRDEKYTGNRLVERFKACGFSIVKFHYAKTMWNINYGKLIAVRIDE